MYSLFVGDLTPEVDDGMLYEFFYNRFPSCRGGKVVLDSMGNSKWVLTWHSTKKMFVLFSEIQVVCCSQNQSAVMVNMIQKKEEDCLSAYGQHVNVMR